MLTTMTFKVLLTVIAEGRVRGANAYGRVYETVVSTLCGQFRWSVIELYSKMIVRLIINARYAVLARTIELKRYFLYLIKCVNKITEKEKDSVYLYCLNLRISRFVLCFFFTSSFVYRTSSATCLNYSKT